jgi:hypothetical protein
MLRTLAVAAVLAPLRPLPPDTMGSCGRGAEALVLAILDGSPARDQVGPRLEERGMVPHLQAGLQRESLHEDRLGPILDALFAAHLHQGCSTRARKALQVYASPPLGLHQETTTMTR